MSDQTSAPDPLADAFDGFRGEALPLIGAPGVADVQATVRRRRQVRAGAAVCVLALFGGGVFALASHTPAEDRITVANPSATASPSPEPSDTPTAAPSPTATASAPPLATTDWRNRKLEIPAMQLCPGGSLTFSKGSAASGDYSYRIQDLAQADGDVTGDGKPETVLYLRCGQSGDYAVQALVVFAQDGSAAGSVVLPDPEDKFNAVSIRAGAIRATVGLYTNSQTQVRTYTWNGKVFKQTGGPTGFADTQPPLDVTQYDWLNTALPLPFAGSTVTVPGGTCPTGTVTFSNGKASKGGCHYEITQMQAQAAVGDVNGDGIQDILQGIKVDKGSSWDMWMYVYTVKNNKPVLVGFVTAGNLTGSAATGSVMAINVPRLANGKVSIEQDYSKLAQSQKRTFSWNGSRFVPSKAPLEARADARP